VHKYQIFWVLVQRESFRLKVSEQIGIFGIELYLGKSDSRACIAWWLYTESLEHFLKTRAHFSRIWGRFLGLPGVPYSTLPQLL